MSRMQDFLSPFKLFNKLYCKNVTLLFDFKWMDPSIISTFNEKVLCGFDKKISVCMSLKTKEKNEMGRSEESQ